MDRDSLSLQLGDPVALAQALIRRPSVTPADAGAMDLVQGWLEALGFACRRMPSGGIENLYARRGGEGPNLCFAGHVDVVPPGAEADWSAAPFGAFVRDGALVGRGAADMKGGVAAWIAAAARTGGAAGPLSLLITGDEEGEALHGTRTVVETLRAEGERIDHCLVGEPTSVSALGDMVKVGRRGSFYATITVEGVQGHVAYPHRAANPVPVLVALCHRLATGRLDEGYPEFQASNLELTDLEVGNPTRNLIPAKASAKLSIRFNPNWTGAKLHAWLQAACDAAGGEFAGTIRLESRTSGEAFFTGRGPFTSLVAEAVREATGVEPELSTSGGTSDARFIRALCPVVEFGLVGATMHKVDERVPLADLETLTQVYAALIGRYHSTFAEAGATA